MQCSTSKLLELVEEILLLLNKNSVLGHVHLLSLFLPEYKITFLTIKMSLFGPVVKLSRAIKERGWKGTLTQLYLVSLS